jgi:hypothetical protein
MSIHEITQKLNGVRKSQSGFIARCPAHDDKKQSLKIDETGGKVLLQCYAGCPTDSIVKAMGVEWKDLFHQPNQRGSIRRTESHGGVMYFASPKAKVAAVYRYTDETGKLLYENVRFEPKDFRQRHYDDKGNAKWGLDYIERVPYRLPDLAKKDKSDVWLCEGEKDADSMAELGFIASSFKNWRAEFNRYISKTNVIILRDHDLPGGVQANDAARLISKATASVKVLDVFGVPPSGGLPAEAGTQNMPEKHGPDISDYIRQCVQDEGMTREEIAERISITADGCPNWVEAVTAASNLFVVKSGNQWLDDAKTRPAPKMLFGEFWFEGELCILFADTNVGKSILAVQIGDQISRGGVLSSPPYEGGVAAASADGVVFRSSRDEHRATERAVSDDLSSVGTPAKNHPPATAVPLLCKEGSLLKTECEARRVVYFDFELTDKQFESRLSTRVPGSETYTDHYRFNDNFRRAEVDPETRDLNGFKTFEDFLNHSLDRTIVEQKAEVLIIDNLTYLRDETENARNALPLMKYLKEIKSRHGISILALAHTPKRDSSKPLGRNDLQGSKMLINFCDSSFAIGESHKESGLRYLKQIKARNSAIIYDADNVLLCNIEKRGSLLQFVFNETATEREHLKDASDKEKDALITKVKEMAAKGMSSREIAEEVGVSHVTVTRYLKQ